MGARTLRIATKFGLVLQLLMTHLLTVYLFMNYLATDESIRSARRFCERLHKERLGVNYQLFLTRARRNIGVEIWRRLASMVHSCMPKLAPDECQLLSGTREMENPYPGGSRLNTLTSL